MARGKKISPAEFKRRMVELVRAGGSTAERRSGRQGRPTVGAVHRHEGALRSRPRAPRPSPLHPMPE